mgnify:CR=1 FL=1
MPQWAGSSWYFLRFCDPHNDRAFADPDKLKYWMPVDHYNGGMEHVTRHLLYSRFWHQFLYDIKEVPTPEPYAKRTYQGLILGPDGEKMSKSKGNVIDPLNIVDLYGADTLRTYVLFMSDYTAAAPWSEEGVRGVKRFLDRVAGLTDIATLEKEDPSLESKTHKTIKKVSEDIERMKFNTAIAALMTLINDYTKAGAITRDDLITFIKLLHPFAPHLTEEIYENIGGEGLLTLSAWPEYDEAKTKDAVINMGVQINGKVRGNIDIPAEATQDDAVGEAFDKVARVLGLPYPGGPEIEKLAKDGKPTIDFPKGFHNKNTLDFSYSGLKTSVINYMHTAAQKGEEVNKADVACSFQKSAVGVMTENVEKALLKTGLKTVVIAGGVASNKHLREEMEKVGKKHGVNVIYPPLKLCTDNAAMIGACAYNLIKEGKGRASLNLDASASVSLE